jgi:hypothetical protein
MRQGRIVGQTNKLDQERSQSRRFYRQQWLPKISPPLRASLIAANYAYPHANRRPSSVMVALGIIDPPPRLPGVGRSLTNRSDWPFSFFQRKSGRPIGDNPGEDSPRKAL